MRRTFAAALVLLVASAIPARAQVVVIDPANLYQTILIAERTWQQYQELRRQFETVTRMARVLGNSSFKASTDNWASWLN